MEETEMNDAGSLKNTRKRHLCEICSHDARASFAVVFLTAQFRGESTEATKLLNRISVNGNVELGLCGEHVVKMLEASNAVRSVPVTVPAGLLEEFAALDVSKKLRSSGRKARSK